MASTGWDPVFELTEKSIKAAVTKISPGAYALGRHDGKNFFVKYVGRSDKDLKKRLLDHVGKYTHFKAGYFDSAFAAFEKECRMYHDFNPADNVIHPDRPDGSKWKCPVCKIFT